MVTLSVLDQVPVFYGSSAAQAIQETITLAQTVERMGYKRFWVAEHHSNDVLACPAPEIFVATIAAHTHQIRVGSGGVMLPHYSPLKVAETFRLLSAMYPGRIDLGIGRGPGAGELTCKALQSQAFSMTNEEYAQQIQELIGFLADALPEDHPYKEVRAMPDGPATPDVWLLGAGPHGAEIAATQGLSYSFAQFFQKQTVPQVLENYRQHFQPSSTLQQARANLAVRVICADTEAEAQRLASSFWRLILAFQGRKTLAITPEGFLRIPVAEDTIDDQFTTQDHDYMQENELMMITGNPSQVHNKLTELAELYGVDELTILTICPDLHARIHSYALLAQAFGIQTATQPGITTH
jgi:luciferase family oxidoreductase group 1